jgi:TolB protein
MKKTQIIKIAIVPMLLMTLIACNTDQAGSGVVIQEPGNTTAVVDDAGKEAGNNAGKPDVSVGKIDRYENIAISDWMDEETIVISKENEGLGKMSLKELSDSYPKSLYLYHLNTKKYELLKEQKNVFLGEAVLSSDKKHLLYSEFTLGDPVYHVMNLDTLDSFGIMGEPIAGALSAHWSDDERVIGPAYSGGAFTASTSGEISAVAGLNGEALVIVQKMKDKIYYNTNSDESLHALDLKTKEKASLNLEHVYGVFPSPDGNQMLVLQSNDPKQTIILCDADGGNRKIIAEGTELGGFSWSPDQRMIAYSLKTNVNGTTVNGLYFYDLLTDKSTQIAVDTENLTTSWSPTGRELAYTEWNGNQNSSSIVHLTYSSQT